MAARERARESAERAETVASSDEIARFLQALPVLYSLTDAHGQLMLVGDHSRDTLFRTPDSDVRSLADLYPADTANELMEANRRVLETGEVVRLPMWLPDQRGGRRHFAMIKFPVEGDTQRLVGSIAIDISPFASTAWDASTYKQILDAISDMILVKGPKSRLLWANKAFQDAYGMSNVDLQGILEAPHVEPDFVHQYVRDDARVFATASMLDIPEEPMAYADGSTRLVHTVKSPIFGPEGDVTMLVAVIRDITESKRLEAELHQAQKLESLGRLAAGMAHEINTPIQFIGDQRRFAETAMQDLLELIGAYQGLAAKVAAGSATVQDAIAIREAEEAADLVGIREGLGSAFTDMAEGVTRVSRLVRALKEFGHPDDGSHELADINAAIQRTVVVATNEYRYVADVVLNLADIPPIACNISELQQVVLNLIVNAAHAIADMGAAERGTIEIVTSHADEHVMISVRDTGCGIPEAIRKRVFDPFFTTKSVGRGTGQGLAIARVLVDKHRGTLTFDTTPGTGTTFTIRIPTSPPPAK